ncbi:Lrp/AsnC family transcriptional regulator [Paenibacillus ehimensis]|uniref:Lrp/AsnC family transcriptional regulator n=1 Tax=Paenibacillus ehimensis TaxID=79264 RepID=A0ABT8V6H8_9BACL|nr:Lrp/AsnC family transcriptional regulator [Paenibacillus ehimensis]MDO3675887.1 Lrp/AsnC family transcriptional regulator [Paenibacillus ehimensis]MEC0208509.1 Lrp/AsnC family transcriptional regulator [Paenibacillus ehimensis]
MELDQTDIEIIRLLRQNARIQWKEIGEHVFLSGQAVGNRIKRLEDLGIIQAYTVQVNEEKMGRPVLALITVFMKSTNHSGFESFVRKQEAVIEAYRVSGEGCYTVKAAVPDPAALNGLLDEILRYGNYKVNLAIGKVK